MPLNDKRLPDPINLEIIRFKKFYVVSFFMGRPVYFNVHYNTMVFR